ncbi:DUF1922 domain-containing protein [Candidatus Woesearchaeota archaeon]|nr:DUF1922 domain-containing protein [Candidatus Woesearchaeota archaeon]
MNYKVFQCHECGTVQASTASSVFKCVRCGKTKLVRKAKILKSGLDGRTAAIFVQEYMKIKWQSENQED